MTKLKDQWCHYYVKVRSAWYVTSHCIQKLLVAFFKYEHAVFNGEQESESIIRVGMGKKNPSLEITVCHHSASLLMSNCDPQDGFFYPTLQFLLYTRNQISKSNIITILLEQFKSTLARLFKFKRSLVTTLLKDSFLGVHLRKWRTLEKIIEILCSFVIQVNLAMSNLLILNTRAMSKWSFIPKFFPYIALYFDLAYFKLGFHENLAISKRFFIPESRFSLCLPLLVSKWSKSEMVRMTNKVIYLIDRTIALISAQLIHCCV